jgi:glycosyltransferase involved in cell wall biosynthesis
MYKNHIIKALDFLYTNKSVLRARKKMQRAIIKKNENSKKRQLLVDVSVIIKTDARTGIQRVVRAILKHLLENPPVGYDVKPVYACAAHNYRYADSSFSLVTGSENIVSMPGMSVSANTNDIFLGLDLATHVLSKHQSQLECWKRNGVKIHILVYDLLPVLHPEWFNRKTCRYFRRWLHSIAIVADSAICISKTVKNDLAAWLEKNYSFTDRDLPINIIPMGGNIAVSAPSMGLPENAIQLLTHFKSRKTVLMVGTLEPRKGHMQVIDAFEQIWKNGDESNLLIVGKPGWKTEKLQEQILLNSRYEKNLFWLKNASDEFLVSIYSVSYGLILASEGEGFGLPLIEAMQYGMPILARNLPVFKEIPNSDVSFFEGNTQDLTDAIFHWLNQKYACECITKSPSLMKASWENSANALLACILNVSNNHEEGERYISGAEWNASSEENEGRLYE